MEKINLILLLFYCSFIFSQDSYVISVGSVTSLNTERGMPLILEMYRSIGIEPQIRFSAPERSLIIANSGQVDAEFLRVDKIGQLYENLIQVPEPFYSIDQVIFSLKPVSDITSWSDLKGKKIAYVRGVKLVQESIKGFEGVIETDRLDKAADLLKYGRVEYITAERFNGIQVMKDAGIHDYYISKPLNSEFLYHFVHKKNIYLIPQLNEAIKEIKSR